MKEPKPKIIIAANGAVTSRGKRFWMATEASRKRLRRTTRFVRRSGPDGMFEERGISND